MKNGAVIICPPQKTIPARWNLRPVSDRIRGSICGTDYTSGPLRSNNFGRPCQFLPHDPRGGVMLRTIERSNEGATANDRPLALERQAVACSFAFASDGRRETKCATVADACSAFSTHVVPFASIGRA